MKLILLIISTLLYSLVTATSVNTDSIHNELINPKIFAKLDSGDIVYIDYSSRDTIMSFKIVKLNNNWKVFKDSLRITTCSFKRHKASLRDAIAFKKKYNVKFNTEYNAVDLEGINTPNGLQYITTTEIYWDKGKIFDESVIHRIDSFIFMINEKGSIPKGHGMYYGPYVMVKVSVNAESKIYKLPEIIEVPTRDFISF